LKLELSNWLTRISRKLLVAVLYWLSGLLVGGGLVLAYFVQGMPPLELWHEVKLEHQYSQETHPDIHTIADYIALEQDLFREMEQRVYQLVSPATVSGIQRYRHGSPVDPTAYASNWNRTREFKVDQPRAGVVLLHGLSDSPYSLRQLALTLSAQKVAVVLPRLPGHGTIPAALTRVNREDFRALVRIAVTDLRQQIGPDVPLYIVGYSTGATLALDYCLTQLQTATDSGVAGLVLISPAIGVTPLAALAPWQRLLSVLPGLHELTWQAVLPEFDPYKYNSFPLNAAEQVYALTRQLQLDITALQQRQQMQQLPPVLVFSSAVDATVSVQALLQQLMVKLAGNNNRLVIYDLNQEANTAFLYADAARQFSAGLLAQTWPFNLEVLSNQDTDSRHLQRFYKAAGAAQVEVMDTGLSWPSNLYSLSHLALPFAPDDPAYGNIAAHGGPARSLGNVVLRGERGVLQVPETQLMRLRYNPFYGYQEHQIVDFILGPGAVLSAATPTAVRRDE